MWFNASAVGVGCPTGFRNDHRFIGVNIGHCKEVVFDVIQCFMNIFVFPYRVCKNGNKIYRLFKGLYSSRLQCRHPALFERAIFPAQLPVTPFGMFITIV